MHVDHTHDARKRCHTIVRSWVGTSMACACMNPPEFASSCFPVVGNGSYRTRSQGLVVRKYRRRTSEIFRARLDPLIENDILKMVQ